MKKYRNKEWLDKQYNMLKRSTRQIAEQEGVNPETIRNWLIRFGIERRPASNINFVSLSEEAMEFLNGELLGDASVIWGCKPVSAYYSLSSKYEEYLKWVEKRLLHFGIARRGTLKSYKSAFGVSWLLQSRYYRGALPALRQLWYPNDMKCVPKDLKLTPTTTKMWFLEDGSVTQSHYINSITFATNGFSHTDVILLRDLLSNAIGDEKVYIRKASKKGFLIEIYKKSVIKDFYDYIGDCPRELEKVYGYKWRLS